ncbi:MAG: hypothetical protein AAFZ91_05815 [Pseudomonadota bacterium]
MDIKEIGGCAVLVIGGVTYGIASGGLKDALDSDIRLVTEVAYEDRAEYMDDVVDQFTAAFETYIVQTETYDYVGYSEFSATPWNATFVETVTSEERIPNQEMSAILRQTKVGFCAQEEMTMFTDKGWSYDFSMFDGAGRAIGRISCTPDRSKFPANHNAIG